MAKRRKRKSGILSGLVIVLCILIVLPILTLTLKANVVDKENLEEKPKSYYKVSFIVDDCCVPIEDLYVEVGKRPVLPECNFNCGHSVIVDTGWVEGHVFINWTYNGQYISEFNCPAFNTDVVLVANIEDVAGAPLIEFPSDWWD